MASRSDKRVIALTQHTVALMQLCSTRRRANTQYAVGLTQLCTPFRRANASLQNAVALTHHAVALTQFCTTCRHANTQRAVAVTHYAQKAVAPTHNAPSRQRNFAQTRRRANITSYLAVALTQLCKFHSLVGNRVRKYRTCKVM